MLFEAMYPFFEGIGQEKLCDVFGKTVDLLQKIQDEALDQDLLHGMQDTPDAVRNRMIAELFGFPIGQQYEKNGCAGKKSCRSKKRKATQCDNKSEPGNLYPTVDLQSVADELLSGSSKETLNDVRARLFGKRAAAAAPEKETVATAPEETKMTEKPKTIPEEEPNPETGIPSPTAPEERTQSESAKIDDTYEWKFPAEKWCGPNDASVTVTDSIIRLNVSKEELNPENNVTTRKTLEFNVGLPEDALVDQMVACFSEETSEFILNVPKRKPRNETIGRSVPINFIQS